MQEKINQTPSFDLEYHSAEKKDNPITQIDDYFKKLDKTEKNENPELKTLRDENAELRQKLEKMKQLLGADRETEEQETETNTQEVLAPFANMEIDSEEKPEKTEPLPPPPLPETPTEPAEQGGVVEDIFKNAQPAAETKSEPVKNAVPAGIFGAEPKTETQPVQETETKPETQPAQEETEWVEIKPGEIPAEQEITEKPQEQAVKQAEATEIKEPAPTQLEQVQEFFGNLDQKYPGINLQKLFDNTDQNFWNFMKLNFAGDTGYGRKIKAFNSDGTFGGFRGTERALAHNWRQYSINVLGVDPGRNGAYEEIHNFNQDKVGVDMAAQSLMGMSFDLMRVLGSKLDQVHNFKEALSAFSAG